MKKKLISLFLISILLCGCSGGVNDSKQTGEPKCEKEIFAMDTIMNLTIYGENASSVMNDAVSLIQRLDKAFSVTNKDSDIAKLNNAGGKAVSVSDDTYELLQRSLEFSNKTDGLFDISIYPLVKAWGFTTEDYHVPDEQTRKKILANVDYKKVKLLNDNKVQMKPGMEIELGAVAKGYLSQKLMDLLKEQNIRSAIVSLGGNVQALGEKEGGNPFVVGITDPADGSSLYGTIEVKNQAVITSGIYQRYFEEGGKRYHHIMDKRSGMPADNSLASVTVISSDGVQADALATALYVMGDAKAKEYQENHPEIQLILIYKDGNYWQSENAGMKRTGG